MTKEEKLRKDLESARNRIKEPEEEIKKKSEIARDLITHIFRDWSDSKLGKEIEIKEPHVGDPCEICEEFFKNNPSWKPKK